MRQRKFGDVPCEIRVIAGPIAKSAAEAMNGFGGTGAPAGPKQCFFRYWPAGGTRKNILVRCRCCVALDRGQDRYRGSGQGHDMDLPLALFPLHSIFRDSPQFPIKIDFAPYGKSRFLSACRRKDAKFECPRPKQWILGKLAHEPANVFHVDRCIMLNLCNIAGFIKRVFEPALPCGWIGARWAVVLFWSGSPA